MASGPSLAASHAGHEGRRGHHTGKMGRRRLGLNWDWLAVPEGDAAKGKQGDLFPVAAGKFYSLFSPLFFRILAIQPFSHFPSLFPPSAFRSANTNTNFDSVYHRFDWNGHQKYRHGRNQQKTRTGNFQNAMLGRTRTLHSRHLRQRRFPVGELEKYQQ